MKNERYSRTRRDDNQAYNDDDDDNNNNYDQEENFDYNLRLIVDGDCGSFIERVPTIMFTFIIIITTRSSKPARIHMVLNDKQSHMIRACYNANPRPDALMKEHFVKMTGLNPKAIRV